MKKAFSMVELIFVIVLLGILVSIGGNLLPDHRLLNATNFVTMKIKETQKNAIGNDIHGFDRRPWSWHSSSTCIDLNVTGFEQKDLDSQKPFEFGDLVEVDGNNVRLCFDEFGRPYRHRQEQLLLENVEINVTYNNRTNRILVWPMSGYVTIEDN